MNDADLRAWWSSRQALDGRLAAESEAKVLAATGWARSVAGASPYLALHARTGASREAVDRAVERIEIQELPAARGCVYVVPRQDFALALRVCQASADTDMAAARKLGVTDQEVDRLATRVLDALKAEPLDPDGLKLGLGAAVRNLGEEGKKKGVTTTLPLALGRLQASGDIRRIAAGGRLDQQRYRYARWTPNPLAGYRLTAEETWTELARRYFDWIALATLAGFQAFSGLGAKAAKAAIAPLDFTPVAGDSGRLLPASLTAEFTRFRAPDRPQYSLVGSLDSFLLLGRNLADLLESADRSAIAPTGQRTATLGSLSESPNHAIVDRGHIVGLWDYDPEHDAIVSMALRKPDAGMREAVARTQDYIRRELGDARSFSLDSPKSRAPRLAALRAGRG